MTRPLTPADLVDAFDAGSALRDAMRRHIPLSPPGGGPRFLPLHLPIERDLPGGDFDVEDCT